MSPKQKDAPLWLAVPISAITWLATAFFAVLFNVLDVLFFVPVSAFCDKGTRAFVHWGAIGWARGIITFTPIWKAQIDGLEHIDRKKQYLIVCNHQSLLDILVVTARLPVLFKFLAKKELFQIPFVGWHMNMAKYIQVDRSSRVSRHQALVQIAEWLARGVSILFFPEGTRSLDGEIHEFHPAAFKIARDAGVEILPVVVDGTGDALPKHSLLLKKRTCFRLSVLPPVPMKNVSDRDIESVQESTRQSMIARLRAIRHAA